MLSKHTSLKVQEKVCCCIDVLSGLMVKLGFGPEGCVVFLLGYDLLFLNSPGSYSGLNRRDVFVSKSVPVFCHTEAYLFTLNVCSMSLGWLEVQTRLNDSAAPDVCVHIIYFTTFGF